VDIWRIELLARPEDRSLLSDSEQDRARRYVRPVDGERFVARRAAVRQILARYLNVVPAGISFAEIEGHRPRLATRGGSDLAFSWSHSAGVALLAVAASRGAIGVDLEAARPLSQPAALQAALRVCGPRTDRQLLQAWTRVEALLKAAGIGLAALADPVVAQLDGPDPERTVQAWATEFRVVDLPLGQAYLGAYAVA
jgi:4'-phosphopantetheinyl transferase